MQWHLPWVWLPPSKVQLPAKRMPFHKHLRQDERLKFRCLEFFHIFPTFTSHPPKNVKFLHAFTSVPLPPRQQTFSQGTDSSTVYDGIQLELLPSMSQQVNCPLPLTGLFTCSDSRCKSYDIFGKTHPPWTQVGFLTIKDGKCRFPGDRLCAGGQHGTVQYHVALEAGRKQDLGSASLYGVVTRDLYLQNRVWGCIGGRGRMSYLHPLLACTCMTLKIFFTVFGRLSPATPCPWHHEATECPSTKKCCKLLDDCMWRDWAERSSIPSDSLAAHGALSKTFKPWWEI